MTTFQHFLNENAKFPFPNPSISGTAASTDISDLEVGSLEDEWKALRAVRDDDLGKKLCDTLETILGDASLNEGSQRSLSPLFLPTLLVPGDGRVNRTWMKNPDEAHVSIILVPREFELSLWVRARGY